MTTYTPNYKLPEYEGTDKPDLTDQYNEAMNLLDAALAAAQAARADLQNSINTTNVNLAATNTQLGTLETKVDGFDGRITANETELQTQSGDVAALQADVTALQDTQGNHSTAIENLDTLTGQHTAQFTALGVTDDQTAADLHTQIDNAYQAAMSNTSAVASLQQTDMELSEDIQDLQQKQIAGTWTVKSNESKEGRPFTYMSSNVAVNAQKNTIKYYGLMRNNGTENITVTLDPIPGESWHGIKLNAIGDTGLRPAANRWFYGAGIEVGVSQPYVPALSESIWCLATDGYIYSYCTPGASTVVSAGSRIAFFQIPMFLDPGDWPDIAEPDTLIATLAMDEPRPLHSTHPEEIGLG